MKLKNIKELLKLTDKETVRDFLDNDCIDGEADYLIIREDAARKRVYDLYRDDYYMLGCFNAWFISRYICLDEDTIQTLQKEGAHEGIGKAIMNSGNFEDMMNDYIDADGYGHALGAYDDDYNEYYVTDEDVTLIIVRMN
jgi:hypothetical protein